MLKVILVIVLFTLASSAPINPSLAKTLAVKGNANIIVRLNSGTEQILNRLNSIKFHDRVTRLNTVTNSLKAHAYESQKEILNLLSSIKGLTFHSLWISNEIFIPNADAAIVKKLTAFDSVAEIREERIIKIDEPINDQPGNKSRTNILVEPEIDLIQAPLVWSQFGNNGTGVVVANIDTGVRGTHQSLRNNFLGDYGWYDPYRGSLIPTDTYGHGTHTIGTIAGSNGIGVAPGAKWMACRACEYECTESSFIRCAQFITCPTRNDGSNPDCSKAPHVVSNSWERDDDDAWFNPSIAAWKAAGIIPVFSSGNSGPSCQSVRSPGNSRLGVISVGATEYENRLASYSSSGPTTRGAIKPDISAPGSNIRSASYRSDISYEVMSGTSMSSPHVAGVVALLAAENPNLSYIQVEKFLYENTDRVLVSPGRNCGGISDSTYPNNSYGWGRLNAYKSVSALRNQQVKN